MESITPQSILKRNPELVSSNIDGEIVMMSVANSEYYGLDEIGSRIWELLENPISADELIRVLLSEFDVEETTCNTDTFDFLNDLHKNNLVIIL